VLGYIHVKYPDTEKVDFIVERKEGVFEKIKQFYEGLGDSIARIGHPELVKYMGELIPAGKDRVPVQAADMLCWHASRADLGLLKGRDAMRAGTIFNRKGKRITLPDDIHFELARALAEKIRELEKLNERESRVRQFRPNNAKTDERPSRRDKSRSGRGKARERAKEEAEG
jgi:hypothetical protein